MTPTFRPTAQQQCVIAHEGCAFVNACPGAGKTRVMVERARHVLAKSNGRRGIAFLSFTKAAVGELQARLYREHLLPSPPFPSFIGTFDSFLWQFFVAPYGLPDSDVRPRLVPDKGSIEVRPFDGVIPLRLDCFDYATGRLNASLARKAGYDATADLTRTRQYEGAAATRRRNLLARGDIDFAEARTIARERIKTFGPTGVLGRALAARFMEAIIDEAQDCNPDDLEVIDWLRAAGLPTKVICDPHQSIYQFRGGVTDELFKYAETFKPEERLPMLGNFRSSAAICQAVVSLKAKDSRENPDEPLGGNKSDPTPVYVISYANGVSREIGESFSTLVRDAGLAVQDCPVLAATKASGANAIGQPSELPRNDLTSRLALAVTNFHFALELGDIREALQHLHHVVLDAGGRLKGRTYHQAFSDEALDETSWRSEMIALARLLKFHPDTFATADEWHRRAKELMAPYVEAGASIGKRFPNNRQLGDTLSAPSADVAPARTIHAVKGKEFPGVCVVLTNAKGIIDYLETGSPADKAEDSREIYVAASRAERLLAIAVPKSQTKRLVAQLESTGTPVQMVQLWVTPAKPAPKKGRVPRK